MVSSVLSYPAQAFEFPFLSPYLQSVGSDFTRGVNFASSGATASNSSVASPFYFEVQTEQFRYFKERTLAVWNAGEQGGSRGRLQTLLTKPEYFEKGLYIVGLGINDFLVPLIGRIESIEQVQANAPHATANAILSGVKSLYQQGARNIMVLNVPPAGCYPVSVQMLGPWNASALDSDGCVTALNSAIQASNALLKAGLDDLRARTADASIILADLYSSVKTLITNGSQFGKCILLLNFSCWTSDLMHSFALVLLNLLCRISGLTLDVDNGFSCVMSRLTSETLEEKLN
jgi:phospholipase/lecithinase/hemolysin